MRQLRISKIANPIIREGVLIGSGTGILLLLISALSNIYPGILLLNYVVIIGGYTFAGYRATRSTKLIKTGLLAGITAGSIAYLINQIPSIVITIINFDASFHSWVQMAPVSQRTLYTKQSFITSLTIILLIGLLIFGIVTGALFGTLGAFLSKQRRTVATTSDKSVGNTDTTSDEPVDNISTTSDEPVDSTDTTSDEPVDNIGTTSDEPVNGVHTTDVVNVVDAPKPAHAAARRKTFARIRASAPKIHKSVDTNDTAEEDNIAKLSQEDNKASPPTLKKNYRKFLPR